MHHGPPIRGEDAGAAVPHEAPRHVARARSDCQVPAIGKPRSATFADGADSMTEQLVKLLQAKSADQLRKLLCVSANLTKLNYDRWPPSDDVLAACPLGPRQSVHFTPIAPMHAST